ncbi:DUF2165 domain-containing protein [Goodfellowiella coeruleoviolacea]|uniref:Small integral membrane protein n=1 Tax=Goodfellowiella coeruleoviolacea TaxID=334858 RepID=A0AAE3G9U5_9PSEU|nr:DUF2165 domain-containing protein [Goodfellowiella coeruleoviolacea]MCP2163539.1 putative small integral membrane protein [Goodfellowiella coeruleoviolacea]
MRFLAWFGGLPGIVTLLTATTAAQMGLIAFGNITDFGTNQAFVQHVFAMDTTFQSPNTMWRAITSPGVATAAYVLIIAWEAVTAVVLAAGFVVWLRSVADQRRVVLARQLSSAGWLMMVLLFAGGFITVGGEWFQMWQSEQWNGLQPALQNFLIASVGLLLTHLPARADRGVAAAAEDR